MEKQMSTTGQGGTSSTIKDVSYSSAYRSPSPSPSLWHLNYQTGRQDFTMYQPLELEMIMASRSPHSELLMDLHHHQDLMDRHNAVLCHLKETDEQAKALRQDNINLKMVNADLTNRLSLLLRTISDYAAAFGFAGVHPNTILDAALHGLGLTSLGGGTGEEHWDDVATEGDSPRPTSVMDSGRIDGNGDGMADRVSLPKSISVRSNGYLKPVQAGGSSRGQVNKQKVYVRGGEKEEQPLGLEVYNQGMSKTELCNKRQDTGACPYGEHCQFAHGIEELRPVLRHPRYKTQVCRMVLNGDHCPYGHRCHFRHTLAEQEKHMDP